MASVLKDSPVPPHPSGHRNIVLALDKTEDSEKILRWARQYHKSGDVLHIAHVAKVVGHKDEIFHGISRTPQFIKKSVRMQGLSSVMPNVWPVTCRSCGDFDRLS